MSKSTTKILVIVGPTASGKSDMALKIARKFNGEIISADSRQVYRGMDIGTGKVSKKEQRFVPHHLIDVASPKKQFTADDFKKLGQKAIKEILAKNKMPLIVGGTGFYIDVLIGKISVAEVPPNPKLRKRFGKLSAEHLFEMLRKLDPERAKTIDPKNKLRLIRALEIVMTTGKPMTKPVLNIEYETLWLGLNQSKDLPDEVKSNLQIAYDSNERLAKLVEDMLTISRIEGRRLKLEKTEFDIHALMQEIFNELVIRAKEKQVSFTVQPATNKVMIEADRERIREVFINIIGNALKFTPDGGKVDVSSNQTGDQISFSVTDTGPGIATDDLSKLFKKFGKLDSSYKKIKESGTGLGLYITKQIVDLHDGKIEVKSVVDQGTTFMVSLPLKK